MTPALVLVVVLGSPVHAAPVRTLLVGGVADGSLPFARDLAQLWRARDSPTPERLAVRTVAQPGERLRALRPGRADFAILPVDLVPPQAGLAESSDVRVIGILWPEVLHAFTRQPEVQALRLPLNVPVEVSGDAAYAYRALREIGALSGESGAPLTLGPPLSPADLEQRPTRGVLLFSAPAPAEELATALRANGALHLVFYEPRLLEELTLRRPWLQPVTVPREAYPKLRAALEAPARYLVLVAGPEVPDDTVRKLLATVWGAPRAAARLNPLFGQIDRELNRVFGPLLPYHPVSAQAFGLEPAETENR